MPSLDDECSLDAIRGDKLLFEEYIAQKLFRKPCFLQFQPL